MAYFSLGMNDMNDQLISLENNFKNVKKGMSLLDIRNENNIIQFQKLNRKMRKIFPMQDKESLIAQLKEFNEKPILKIESDMKLLSSI